MIVYIVNVAVETRGNWMDGVEYVANARRGGGRGEVDWGCAGYGGRWGL